MGNCGKVPDGAEITKVEHLKQNQWCTVVRVQHSKRETGTVYAKTLLHASIASLLPAPATRANLV